MRHSCRTLLWGTAPKLAFLAIAKIWQLPHVATTFAKDTFARKNLECVSCLVCFLRGSGVLVFLQESHVKSAERAFRTRLPQKLTLQVCKASVSYNSSSKIHASSRQNKHSVRDFLQQSSWEAGSPIGAHTHTHTHQAALPSSFAIPAPPNNTRPHANPNVTATFTSATPCNLTIP